jgi:ABC-2 type transport system permease protein
VSALAAVHGIVVRDLTRALRQRSRLIGGIVRPFMWLLLVGGGYNSIARVEGVADYQAFIFPGVVVMAMLFGSMLTAISTVYDREFGMLRLMLASPAGVGATLAGRALAAAAIGLLQGTLVLVTIPMFASVTLQAWFAALGALALSALASSMLGLLVAAPLQSVENFAGVINIVLFPLLFLSGALYPTARMPEPLRTVARLNPVSYAVDLTRSALGQAAEFGTSRCLIVLGLTAVAAFTFTAIVFDPERRVSIRERPKRTPGA